MEFQDEEKNPVLTNQVAAIITAIIRQWAIVSYVLKMAEFPEFPLHLFDIWTFKWSLELGVQKWMLLIYSRWGSIIRTRTLKEEQKCLTRGVLSEAKWSNICQGGKSQI